MGHSDLPDSLSKRSSPTKAATAAVRDEVVTAGAGGDRAVAEVETTAAGQVVLLEPSGAAIVVQLRPRGAAMVQAALAAAVTVATTSPLAAVSAADREAQEARLHDEGERLRTQM